MGFLKSLVLFLSFSRSASLSLFLSLPPPPSLSILHFLLLIFLVMQFYSLFPPSPSFLFSLLSLIPPPFCLLSPHSLSPPLHFLPPLFCSLSPNSPLPPPPSSNLSPLFLLSPYSLFPPPSINKLSQTPYSHSFPFFLRDIIITQGSLSSPYFPSR